MNSDQIIALAAVATSGVVGVASLGFSFWNSSRERAHRLEYLELEQDERYRLGSYERRLIAHQEAYKWLMDLIEPLREAMGQHPHEDRGTYMHSELASKSLSAREWWDANCLYLDQTSRSLVVDFIEVARSVAECDTLPTGMDAIRRYRDALRAVDEGIGKKHLPPRERTRRDAR